MHVPRYIIKYSLWKSNGPVLRQFLGPDSKPFMLKDGNEGCYIFSLCMDGFNLYQNKEAGKKASIGTIYMVCLNLPPSMCYKMENIFLVDIISGPHEPAIHQINHLLQPLVDNLLDFWKDGMFYTQTALHSRALLIHCAVVPLVCNLPAARQMSGFASYSSNTFCSFCLQTLEHIEDLDYKRWKSCMCEEHRKIAQVW